MAGSTLLLSEQTLVDTFFVVKKNDVVVAVFLAANTSSLRR